jgi:hypothetical protein
LSLEYKGALCKIGGPFWLRTLYDFTNHQN